MQVYLGIGSNEGNKRQHIDETLELLRQKAGTIADISGLYETEPWGFQCENSFVNLVLALDTNLEPIELLRVCKQMEKEAGRKQKNNAIYESRPLDIDILFYENRILKTQQLTIPHPLIQERMFVLKPFCDIAPDFKHPLLNETMEVLLQKCTDESWIREIKN